MRVMDSGFYPLAKGITCIDAVYMRPQMACLYLLEHQGECAIIETGTSHSVAALERVLASRGLRPEQVRYVIPTHVHLDHAGGAGLMMSLFGEAQLLVHPRGARHLVDPSRLIASSMAVYGEEKFRALYGEIVPIAADRVREMDDGEVVLLADRPLQFRHTRGHADHHFCIWDEASRGWFGGDMFGLCYPWFRLPGGDFVLPSSTPTQFRPQDFLDSLALLDSYQPQRIYLTHFGELPYSPAVYQLLAGQVADYPGLAREHGTSLEAMEQAIMELALTHMNALDTKLDRAAMAESLRFDAHLNAQGLAVWLQQHMQE